MYSQDVAAYQKWKLLRQGFQKLEHEQGRHTDTHTQKDATDNITIHIHDW